MKELNVIIPSSSFMIQSEKKDEIKGVEQVRTKEELYSDLYLKPHNKLHKNSRVHTGIEYGNDWYLAKSISPDFKDFKGQRFVGC